MYTILAHVLRLVASTLQPQSFAESRHALFYEGHIEKQKENFVMCGRNFEMRGYESFPFNRSYCEHCDDVRILRK